MIMIMAVEIIPIPKKFASVAWVKILDAQGTAECPSGESVSIHTSLEP